MKRFKAVLKKEFAHIFRDPVSLSIILIMPVLMIFIYGYAINFDLKTVKTGVLDLSGSDLSRKLIKKFKNNNYYKLTELQTISKNPQKTAEEMLKKGSLNQYIIIPARFSKNVNKGFTGKFWITIDGSDSNVANLLHQYNEMIVNDFQSENSNMDDVIKLGTKIYFNPELKSSNFFVPGVIALILIMISALLTAISIAREKEAGSIDLIFISPLKSWEIIVGKTIPYLLIALVSEAIILIFAKYWYNIPFRGSILILLIFSVLYILTGLSLGVLIATVTSNQKSALFAVLLITLLPTVMLSGFIFPLDSLGAVIRTISKVVPATYFLKIIRGVVLKGAEIKHFIIEGLALLVFSLTLIIISIKRFTAIRHKGK